MPRCTCCTCSTPKRHALDMERTPAGSHLQQGNVVAAAMAELHRPQPCGHTGGLAGDHAYHDAVACGAMTHEGMDSR